MPLRAKLILAVLGFIPAVSLTADLLGEWQVSWFQRSGAFVALAGVYLQYLHLIGVWTRTLNAEKALPSVVELTATGQSVGIKEQLEEAVRTRTFVVALHKQLATRASAEYVALALILLGTVVASYGDLLVR